MRTGCVFLYDAIKKVTDSPVCDRFSGFEMLCAKHTFIMFIIHDNLAYNRAFDGSMTVTYSPTYNSGSGLVADLGLLIVGKLEIPDLSRCASRVAFRGFGPTYSCFEAAGQVFENTYLSVDKCIIHEMYIIKCIVALRLAGLRGGHIEESKLSFF